ncbi:MAG: LCP family protein [Lachnospiraceae bacterium]
MMKQGKEARKRRKIAVIVLLVLLLIVIALVSGFQILKAVGKANLRKAAANQAPELESQEVVTKEEEEEGIISHSGKKYRYNDGITTILCMGVDTTKEVKSKQIGNAGQADAIFLLVLDEKKQKMSLIGIPRDTMTDISIYDMYGTYFATEKEHLALQYAYGDAKAISGSAMVTAVSNLMYGLPIHGYAAINLEAISTINDSVGGVTVTVPGEDTEFLKDNGYTAGEKVTLNGDTAETFVRNRDCKTFASNNLRIGRQKEYMINFIQTAKEAMKGNITLPVQIFQEITPYLNTDISIDKVTYLATLASGMSFDSSQLQVLTGEVRQGEIYEEYYLDENALYELILNVFYEEAK